MIARLLVIAVRARFDQRAAQGLDATFEFHVRAWGRLVRLTAVVADGRCDVRPGGSVAGAARATVSLADMLRMGLGLAGWPELLSSGRLELAGDPFVALRLPVLFRLPAQRRAPHAGRIAAAS
jgi:hypothetical protein